MYDESTNGFDGAGIGIGFKLVSWFSVSVTFCLQGCYKDLTLLFGYIQTLSQPS